MAEDNKTYVNPSKGMHQDFAPNAQPEGTYRFALNTVSETAAGELGYRANERSNFECAQFPEGYLLVGHQYLNDNDVCLFLTNETTSIIALLDENCNFTTLVSSDCLGFSKDHEIFSTFRIKNGCERIVYWVDHNSPDRAINLEDLEQYRDTTDPTKWNCDEFNIDRIKNNLDVSLVEVGEGGSLPIGSVQLIVGHLDSNLNSAGYTDATLPIPIIDDSYTASYTNVDGASSIIQSNKSVTFNISNIDLNYPYLEIVAVVTTAGVSTAYRIDKIPIISATQTYTLSNIPLTATVVDVLDYTIPKDIFSSKAITQLENRLIRGNMKTPYVDFSSWQRDYANKITAKYYTAEIPAEDLTSQSVKTPGYYWDNKSYMRDEIYPFSIKFLMDDYRESPSFHIPGRAKDVIDFDSTTQDALKATGAGASDWDSYKYTVVASGGNNITTINLSEVKHLPGNIGIGEQVERWRVYNTAYKKSGAYASTLLAHSAGDMAYTESQSKYPLTKDCNGEYIFGDLAGTPIRHHKFPDAALEPHYNSGNIYPVGIYFDNITLPPGCIGYKITRADRDSANKTVLDKGLNLFTRFSNSTKTGDITFQPFMYNQSNPLGSTSSDRIIPDGPESGYLISSSDTIGQHTSYNSKICFHSAGTKFNQTALNASHIKNELGFRFEADILSDNVDYSRSRATGEIQNLDGTLAASSYNTSIAGQAYVGTNSVLQAGVLEYKFINNYGTETYAIDLKDDIDQVDASAINYFTDSSASFLSQPNTYHYIGYVSLKKEVINPYGNLEALAFYPVQVNWRSASSVKIAGGDTYISKMYFVQTARMEINDTQKTTPLNNSLNSWNNAGSNSDHHHNWMNIIAYWGESSVNSELRHEEPGEVYYPKSNSGSVAAVEAWLAGLIAIDGSTFTPNFYHYNQDLSIPNNLNASILLPITFKYCSECLNTYPNRVAYSEQSYQEELQDHYRTFLANNYRDINANRGDITNIINHRNTLVIDCEESRFVLPPTTSAIQTTEGTIAIGTGQFFSLPPKELVDAETGYSGSQDPRATDITENGIFSVDAARGAVFLFSTQLDNIGNLGMRSFFEENLAPILKQEWESITGLEYTLGNNPSNPYATGLVSGWDTRLERWILTKRDYAFTEKAKNMLPRPGVSNYEKLRIEDGKWKYTNSLTGVSKFVLPEEEPELFENVSWTISFSTKDKAWVSFHSYIPTHYIDSKSKLITTSGKDSILWEHNQKFKYQRFYGTLYPHIIEFVPHKHPVQTFTYDDVEFITQAKKWDAVNKQFIDKRLITFDKAVLYNSYQSSGLIDLITKREDTLGRSQENWHQQALVDVNEKTYSFNEFRDLVTDYDVPLFTKDWNLSQYSSEYFIDKVVNPSAINLNKDWWEQGIFRDKYLVLRLFFTIFEDIKLVTNFGNSTRGYTER